MLELVGSITMMAIWYSLFGYLVALYAVFPLVNLFIENVTEGDHSFNYKKYNYFIKLEDRCPDNCIGCLSVGAVASWLGFVVFIAAVEGLGSEELKTCLLFPRYCWWLIYPVLLACTYFGFMFLCKKVYQLGKAVKKVRASLDTHIADASAHSNNS